MDIRYNTKYLIYTLYASLMISFLYVSVCSIFFRGNGSFSMLFILFMEYFLLCGYGEVLIINTILIFLIKRIRHKLIKRISYYFIWIIYFSCVENMLMLVLLNLKDSIGIGNVFIFIPPYIVKILFFMYYKRIISRC